MIQIKICGITSRADAEAALEAGADLLGFIFAKSPRQVTAETVRSIRAGLSVPCVGVFVDRPVEEVKQICEACGLQIAQLHGQESPEAVSEFDRERVWKAFRVRSSADLEDVPRYAPRVAAVFLDAWAPGRAGGTGESFDWRLAEGAARFGAPVVLAGGLRTENVARAIRQVQPAILDVSSGVESSPGRKDPEKMREFVAAARRALLTESSDR